jgi:hypothetical protein
MNLTNERYLRMGDSGSTYLSLNTVSVEPVAVGLDVQQQVASNPVSTYIAPQSDPLARSAPQTIPLEQSKPQSAPFVRSTPQRAPSVRSTPQRVPSVRSAPQSTPLGQSVPLQKHNGPEAADEDLSADENPRPRNIFGEGTAERKPTTLYLSNLSAKDTDTSSDLLRFYAKVSTANNKTCSAYTLMDTAASSRYVDEGYAKSLGLPFGFCGVMEIITAGVKHPPQPRCQVWLDASI